jgi:hypothetical protein
MDLCPNHHTASQPRRHRLEEEEEEEEELFMLSRGCVCGPVKANYCAAEVVAMCFISRNLALVS